MVAGDGVIDGQANSPDLIVVPVDVMVVSVVEMAFLKGFGIKPPLHIKAFRRRVVKPGIEQTAGINNTVKSMNNRSAGIDRYQALDQVLDPINRHQVGLGQQQPVGDRRLL